MVRQFLVVTVNLALSASGGLAQTKIEKTPDEGTQGGGKGQVENN